MLSALITAVGLVLVIEGLFYGVFPSAAKKLAELLETTPRDVIQTTGIAMAFVGVVIVWLARG
ncbi:DUF2065 family protein [Ahrensia sp. 13_GOM-1096m]|uniref:DUF2065 domain-containing protein n=1 Tax=Ahrensia sp. 13_GOM-1096m TaxID=1380380 RepID=UPI00047D52C9|nr:DUF2065 family protein [Ahrensia sp. 13_GOM-1096m]